MNQFFLKIKHWQLFILLFLLPMSFQIWMFSHLMNEIVDIIKPDYGPMSNKQNMAFINAILDKMGLFAAIIMAMTVLFFAWLWAMAMGLQHKIPTELSMKTIKFKLCFFFALIYIIMFITLLMFLASNFPTRLTGIETKFFFLVIPPHLLYIFCILYCFYFTAKAIKFAELQRPLKVDDYIGEFFLLWFAYIGVWILQPKVNRIVQNEVPKTVD